MTHLLETLFDPVRSVSCLGARHIPEGWDENGNANEADADDAAYATFEIDGGVVRVNWLEPERAVP